MVYEILSDFADCEYSVNSKVTETKKLSEPPTSKAELLEAIEFFLISETNLNSVFVKFGELHGTQNGEWVLHPDFLGPYRFVEHLIKLNPLMADLFQ